MRSSLGLITSLFSAGVFVNGALAQPCTQPPGELVGAGASQHTYGSCSVLIQYQLQAQAARYEVWRTPNGIFDQPRFLGTTAGSWYSDDEVEYELSGWTFERFYWVRAINDCGAGPFTGPLMGTFWPGRPPAPTNVTAFGDCGSIHLNCGNLISWNQPWTRIWRAPSARFADARMVSSFQLLRWNYEDTNVEAGKSYWYWVEMSNGCCTSPISEAAGATEGSSPVFSGGLADMTCLEGHVFFVDAPVGASLPSWRYQWYKDGVALTNSSRMYGTGAPRLVIESVTPSDEGLYSARVYNGCGASQTNAFALRIEPVAHCPSDVRDYNQDGTIDDADVGAFFIDWVDGVDCADVDLSGGVDGDDVESFFTQWAIR